MVEYPVTVADVVNTTAETTTWQITVDANTMDDGDAIVLLAPTILRQTSGGSVNVTWKMYWGSSSVQIEGTNWTTNSIGPFQQLFQFWLQRVGSDVWVRGGAQSYNDAQAPYRDFSGDGVPNTKIISSADFTSSANVRLTITFNTANANVYWKTQQSRAYRVDAADAVLGISGGGTGATTASAARSNLGLGSMATQNASSVSISGGTIAGDGSGLTALSASSLGSGTIPDARFPSTLPALNGSNLTNLNAASLASGTIPDARFPSTLPALNGSALTALNASNLASGTVPQARKWSEATTTSTGNQDDFNFSDADLLRCNNSSLLTIRGLAAGVAGQRLTIVSVGSGQVDIANQNSNSSAANRVLNGVTGTISLAAGYGRVDLEYDGTTQRWRVVQHEQGAFITPTFNAADFTGNGSMTWSVDSGDISDFSYYLRGKRLLVNTYIVNTTVGGTVNTNLQAKIPGGFTSSKTVNVTIRVNDAGVGGIAGILGTNASSTNLIFFRALIGTVNWSTSTNQTAVFGMIEFEVQ